MPPLIFFFLSYRLFSLSFLLAGPSDEVPTEPTRSIAVLLWVFAYIGVMVLIAREMYKRKLFLKV